MASTWLDRTELQISLGICEGMAALTSRGLSHGALCSVNVEVVQTGGEFKKDTVIARQRH